MANYKTCRTCGAPLHDDDIAIYRKLVYRGAETFVHTVPCGLFQVPERGN